MTNFATLRVSLDKQDVQNQKHGVTAYAKAANLLPLEYAEDTASSRVAWRQRGIGALLERAQAGDQILVAEISRLARTTLEALEIAQLAVKKGVTIHVVKNRLLIDASLQSEIMVTVLGLAAQIEREFISSRTKEALARRKAAGVRLGRPPGRRSKTHKLDAHAADIRRYLQQGIPKATICKLVGCSKPTLYAWLRKAGLIDDKD